MLCRSLWTAGLEGPGHVKLSGDGSVELQNVDPDSKDKGKEIAKLLDDAGLKAQYSENILYEIWKKACVNGTLNSCCAILDCNIKEFGQLKETASLIRIIIKEFADIAEVFGTKLDIEEVAKSIEKIYDPSQAGEHYPSMHQDLVQSKRATEIDYINGFVSRIGKEKNIKTPYCDLLTTLIHSKEQILIKEQK